MFGGWVACACGGGGAGAVAGTVAMATCAPAREIAREIYSFLEQCRLHTRHSNARQQGACTHARAMCYEKTAARGARARRRKQRERERSPPRSGRREQTSLQRRAKHPPPPPSSPTSSSLHAAAVVLPRLAASVLAIDSSWHACIVLTCSISSSRMLENTLFLVF